MLWGDRKNCVSFSIQHNLSTQFDRNIRFNRIRWQSLPDWPSSRQGQCSSRREPHFDTSHQTDKATGNIQARNSCRNFDFTSFSHVLDSARVNPTLLKHTFEDLARRKSSPDEKLCRGREIADATPESSIVADLTDGIWIQQI